MSVETLRGIIRHGAEVYRAEATSRHRVKREIVDRSYQDVNRDSMSVSRIVEPMGMGGKHVTLIGVITYQWIVGYLEIVDSGSTAVPIDAQPPVDTVCGPLDRVDVEMPIFDEIHRDMAEVVREKCPRIRQIISVQTAEPEDGIQFLPMQMAIRTGGYETTIDPDQVCTILSTSGATGKNKGVMLSHENLVDNVVCLGMKIPTGTVSMTLFSINHVYCLTMDIVKELYIGLVICVSDSIMHVQKNMKLFKPKIALLVPLMVESIYGKLRDAGNLMPRKTVVRAAFGGNLKTMCGGDAYLDPDYMERFKEYGVTILQGYGMTECPPVISINLEQDRKTGSVDKLLPDYEAEITDEEIRVGGASMMQGYYKVQEGMDQTLEDGRLKTDDPGHVDEDNSLYVTGRRENLIILSSGENIPLEELGNQLSHLDLVKEVLVREKDKVIEAEMFPDYEYARKGYVKNIEGGFREPIDELNKDMPVYKRIYSLIVREAEFRKTPSRKIKRF